MNKIAKAAIAAAACILLVLAGVRIVRLNQRYPAAETVIYTPGQEAPYGNFSLTVTGSRFLEENEIASLFAQELQEGLDIKCLVLDFQVKTTAARPNKSTFTILFWNPRHGKTASTWRHLWP